MEKYGHPENLSNHTRLPVGLALAAILIAHHCKCAAVTIARRHTTSCHVGKEAVWVSPQMLHPLADQAQFYVLTLRAAPKQLLLQNVSLGTEKFPGAKCGLASQVEAATRPKL